MLAVISPLSATELHRLRKMCEANSAIPNFYSRNRTNIGYRATLANAGNRANKPAKMPCDTDRLCDHSERPSAPAIRKEGLAVNLAAFCGASVTYVAAVRDA